MVKYFSKDHGDFYSVPRQVIGLPNVGCPFACLKQNCSYTNRSELQMKNFDETQLTQFTGTTGYYRISRRHLLTDGTKYLAEEAECFWMMDAIASHLSEIGTEDWFVLVRVQVAEGRAVMIYEDGNSREHARQEIPYTDFPLTSITLYACWDQEHWVVMLPSEY
jgi:hypothetical protein